MGTEIDRVEQLEASFKRRYELKKSVNILVSVIISILGVASFVYIWLYDGDGVLTFRWMTVDGTLYTTAFAFGIVMSFLFSRWNRKLSWVWFKNLGK